MIGTDENEEIRLHEAGFRGEVSMWSFDGYHYWWSGGILWCAEAKADDEKPTVEEVSRARVETLALIAVLLMEMLLCIGFIVFAMNGGMNGWR